MQSAEVAVLGGWESPFRRNHFGVVDEPVDHGVVADRALGLSEQGPRLHAEGTDRA